MGLGNTDAYEIKLRTTWQPDGLAMDDIKAGSVQKLETKEGCMIAGQGEQSSDTRDGVAG